MRHHHQRLMEAPTNVLFIKMDYDDFQTASADLALLGTDASTTSTVAAPDAPRAASATTSKAAPSMTRPTLPTRRS
jgi:hypothetical protein